jgi:thioredoxin 1
MKNVETLEELKTIIESNDKVLVDFWAPWCGPCKMIGPVVEELSEEVSDTEVVKVNIDDNGDAASAFGVSSIPTIVIFKAGEQKEFLAGVQPKKKYTDILENL